MTTIDNITTRLLIAQAPITLLAAYDGNKWSHWDAYLDYHPTTDPTPRNARDRHRPQRRGRMVVNRCPSPQDAIDELLDAAYDSGVNVDDDTMTLRLHAYSLDGSRVVYPAGGTLLPDLADQQGWQAVWPDPDDAPAAHYRPGRGHR